MWSFFNTTESVGNDKYITPLFLIPRTECHFHRNANPLHAFPQFTWNHVLQWFGFVIIHIDTSSYQFILTENNDGVIASSADFLLILN